MLKIFADSLWFCLKRKTLNTIKMGAGHNWINSKEEVCTRYASPKISVKFAYTRRGAAAVSGRLWRKKFTAKKAAVAKPAERPTDK